MWGSTSIPAALDAPPASISFGIEDEDVETVFDRRRASYPSVKWLQRPSNRPFAGITTHDPDGNVFDISQKDMKNRTSVYVENDGKANPRHIDHVAMRTLRPAEMADFFRNVLDRKSTRLNSSHLGISYAVFCLK